LTFFSHPHILTLHLFGFYNPNFFTCLDSKTRTNERALRSAGNGKKITIFSGRYKGLMPKKHNYIHKERVKILDKLNQLTRNDS